MITLTRPLCCVDLECTGLDIAKDRIMEFAVLKLLPDGTEKRWAKRINPGCPIPPEVAELTGISDADVKGLPPFAEYAQLIYKGLKGCDLMGYNIINYDLPMLYEHFWRCGIGWDLTGIRVIDAGIIFKKREERTLSAAVKFYCNREHDGAHGAAADVEATRDVLFGQLERYNDLQPDVDALAEYSKYDGPQRIDLAGKFVREGDGPVLFGFGKHRGEPVANNLGFIHWMMDKDFSQNTLMVARKILESL